VHAALVRERGVADVGLVVRAVSVDALPDDAADLGEAAEATLRQALDAELELAVGDDLRQVGVAAALADAVDRAVDLDATGLDRRQGVRRGEPAVVVDVDTERRPG